MASLRQLARLIGVDEKAVRKAEKAGVFRDALKRGDDGTLLFLDVTAAVDLWEKSGRRLRGSTPPAAAQAVPTSPQPAAPAAVAAARPPLGEIELSFGGDDDAPLPPLPADAPPSLVDAQIAAHKERTRKLRMENDLREGALVEVSQASRQAFEFARTLRENVLNIPLRLAAELAAESDSSRVFRRLDTALREALGSVALMMEPPVAATAVIEQQRTS